MSKIVTTPIACYERGTIYRQINGLSHPNDQVIVSQSLSPAPPQLLVALAGCCLAPGRPQITEKEAISLVKKAMSETQYIEAVELLISLCKSIGDSKEHKHWECILEKIKDTGIHLPSLDQLPKQ